MINQKWGWMFWEIGIPAIAALFGPRIPQPQSYHRFIEQRTFLAIPDFSDVVSNWGFLIVGLWGARLSYYKRIRSRRDILESQGTLALFLLLSRRAADRVWLGVLSLGAPIIHGCYGIVC
jgi:hypothetical protein